MNAWRVDAGASLVADAADAVGSPAAAEELARAGLAYAVAVDHPSLIAQVRVSLAAVVLQGGRFRRCLQMTGSGPQYLAAGPNGAQSHLMTARAVPRLGDQDIAA